MQQADRAFISIARRPAIRAAALLWIWLTVVFAPVGATLHAMSHLTLPPAGATIMARIADDQPADTADPGTATELAKAPGPEAAAGVSAQALPRPHHDDQHGAAEHCHVCDEWQFLDHVLPSAVLANTAAPPLISPAPTPPAMRLFAEAPWILPRAPPRSAAPGAC
ncbi:MAG TPA: hypothetical protein VL522_15665 [Bordetella sp.]|nr:hypothetical protein [Bordetella sp.]